ncbi:hypothetical protein QQ045_028531 [Rhodiola kirilowii]
MLEMNIRTKLAPQTEGKRTYLPPSCTTLSKSEKSSLCGCLKGVKVPYGYSSNIARLVSMKDLRLNGLKSHDCHTLIQQLLPIAIRGVLYPKVRAAVKDSASFLALYMLRLLIHQSLINCRTRLLLHYAN